MKTYEEKRKRAAEYHLSSDLFVGKVFEDLNASQELCRINFPGIVERVKFFKIKENKWPLCVKSRTESEEKEEKKAGHLADWR